MLQLHGIPVPSNALPKVPRDSSTLRSSAAVRPTLPQQPGNSPAGGLAHGEDTNVKFMSSMGSRRIYARNGGSGTVASVHQFHLEDTATTMDSDDFPSQTTVQEMESAITVILQEIGEDVLRPVSYLDWSAFSLAAMSAPPA